jgi:hypothetical protein
MFFHIVGLSILVLKGTIRTKLVCRQAGAQRVEFTISKELNLPSLYLNKERGKVLLQSSAALISFKSKIALCFQHPLKSERERERSRGFSM